MQHYDLGNRIYELRKSLGLSQKELGEMLGVSNKSVSKWENGSAIPKTDTLVKLADVLGVTVQELLQGKTDNRMTLSRLSSQTDAMLLKEEINKRDNEKSLQGLKNMKIYLSITLSIFVSAFIIFTLLALLGLGIDTEEGLNIFNVLFDSLVSAYLLSSIVGGVTFAIRLAKKLPAWVVVILCLIFPITFLLIGFIGVVITPSYVINSIKSIAKERKNGPK